MDTMTWKVLLVEDSPSDADLVQETLNRQGTERFDFTCAECLEDAIMHLRRETFDALLLDLSLPDSAGPDTYLRAREAAPSVPILVMTGADDERLALDAVRHGIQDYLVKGQADGQQICRAIRYAIERKQAEEALKQLQAELEERVRERTAELARTHLALQREVTERLCAEEKQRTAVLEERTRIAREIHDTLAQGFTGIVIHLEVAKDLLHEDLAAASEHMQRASVLARESLNEARRSVWALRPQALEQDDLVTALAALVDRLARDTTARLEFAYQGIPCLLPSEMEDDLLRLCQEALTNAMKHAQARQIRAALSFAPHQVELCVEDDGRGFDPSQPSPHRHFGLRIMEERVARLNGQLSITSNPGQGTRISVLAPVYSEEEEAAQHEQILENPDRR